MLSVRTSAPIGPGGRREDRLLSLLFAGMAVLLAAPSLVLLHSRLIAALLACLLAQCVYGAARSIAAGHRLLQAVFWTFSGCYLAVPAIYQVSTGQAAWRDDFIYNNEERLLITLLIINLAFGMFAVGAAGRSRTWDERSYVNAMWRTRPPRQRRARESAEPSAAPPSRRPRTLMPLAYCAGAFALLPLVILRSGGIATLVSSRAERRAVLSAAGISQEVSGGVAVALVGILPGALALASVYVLLLRWRQGQRPRILVLIAAASLLFLYSNPFANTRYIAVTALVAPLLVVLWPRTVRGMAIIAVGLVIGVLGIYPVANAFRAPDAQAKSIALADIDFDGFQQLVNTRQYVEDQGHTWGYHLGSAALFALPRRVWPDKALPASIPVAENRGYRFTNLSLPLPGEFYLEFGLAGAAAAMFGWGRGWRHLDEAWAMRPESAAAGLVPYLAVAQLGLLRGPVGAMVPIYASTVLLIVLALSSGWLGRGFLTLEPPAGRRRSAPSLREVPRGPSSAKTDLDAGDSP
jgi:hypothetical protein